jgi:hypothetical protein
LTANIKYVHCEVIYCIFFKIFFFNVFFFYINYQGMKKFTSSRRFKRTSILYMVAIAAVLSMVHSCNKSTHRPEAATATEVTATAASAPYQQGALQTKVVTVLGINASANGSATNVIFRELEEGFTISDPTVISALKTAMGANDAVKITFDPWKAVVTQVSAPSSGERMAMASRQIIHSPGSSRVVDLDHTSPDVINNVSAEGILNATTPGLTDVIPDMATAQLMFDYITHQCCALSGPYTIDYCITFQYCEDGCYARAHKMCYIINNKYHYATHKIFSFAYPDGPYTLSVKAEKWGGCCINWWYHVAPLVNIKTATGTQAFVIDPAMFDQPVLLATWLHAQQNPVCEGSNIPKVTSYNLQPTSSYAPYDTATFVTDPLYTDTDTTLVHYRPLVTCP